MLSELGSLLWFEQTGLFETVYLIDYVPERAIAHFELELSTKGKLAYQRVLGSACFAQARADLLKFDSCQTQGEEAGSVFDLKRLVTERLLKNASRRPRPTIQKVDIDDDNDPEDRRIEVPPAPVYVDISLPRQARASSIRRHRSAPSSYAAKVPDDYFKQSLLKRLKRVGGNEQLLMAIELVPGKSLHDFWVNMLMHLESDRDSGKLWDLLLQDDLWDFMLQEGILSEGVIRMTSAEDRALLELAVSRWRDRISFRRLATVLNEGGHLSREKTPFNEGSARNLVIQGLLLQASDRHLKDQ